jgi:hypothetical protein
MAFSTKFIAFTFLVMLAGSYVAEASPVTFKGITKDIESRWEEGLCFAEMGQNYPGGSWWWNGGRKLLERRPRGRGHNGRARRGRLFPRADGNSDDTIPFDLLPIPSPTPKKTSG